jgi:uncharacterized protein
MQHEVDDGTDTVAWMRAQPWFNGRFATFGGSYLGFTQWALLMDPPPELVTAVFAIAPHDFHSAVYRDGAFNLDDYLSWADQVGHQEDPFLKRMQCLINARRRMSEVINKLPLVDAGEQLLAGRSAWFHDWVSRRDPNDPLWQPMKLAASLERVKVPVWLQTGCQDIFLGQTLEQYARLTGRGVDVALTIGPWAHSEIVTKGGDQIIPETLDWHRSGDCIVALQDAHWV